MSERKEYTPDDEDVEETYVAYEERFSAEADPRGNYRRWLAAHDRALREQIAREIEHKREVLSEAQLRILGHLQPVQSGIVAGYTYASRIARGKDQTDE